MKLGPLVVIGVCLLIAFIGLTTQIFIFWKFLGGFTLECMAILGGFNILLGLLCYNFYLACSTDPGEVPPYWEPPKDPSKVLVIEVKKNNAGPRYCRTCKQFKPPRSHHCSSCERCVLKMDHHCPWINNCVGYSNHGHFFRFIIYVDIASAYCLFFMCRRVWLIYAFRHDYNLYYQLEPKGTELLFLILNLILDTLVLLLVGILTIYHTWLIFDNTTTIETMEIDRIRKMVRRRIVSDMEYPYDLGIIANFKQILGPNPWLWLWPQKMSYGGGTEFPIGSHLQPPVYWPPLQSTEYETPTVCTSSGNDVGRRHPTLSQTQHRTRGRQDAEAYALPTINSLVREQMTQVPGSPYVQDYYGLDSDVQTDDYSIDTYDSDDSYDADQDDLMNGTDAGNFDALNRAVDKLIERKQNGYQPVVTRGPPPQSGQTPTSEYDSTQPSIPRLDSGVTISVDATPKVQFTKGSLLDSLDRRTKAA